MKTLTLNDRQALILKAIMGEISSFEADALAKKSYETYPDWYRNLFENPPTRQEVLFLTSDVYSELDQ